MEKVKTIAKYLTNILAIVSALVAGINAVDGITIPYAIQIIPGKIQNPEHSQLFTVPVECILYFYISLISAVWFIRYRHPNQVHFNRRMQIISSEPFSGFQPKFIHKRFACVRELVV